MQDATQTSGPTIFFSAGEPSGDEHASHLIQNLRATMGSECHFRGFGGPRMRENGCVLDYELTSMAVLGFLEVLPKLRKFFQIADLATEAFDTNPPDAVVLVDFPGFNWHIAKRAKLRGIPVFYYLPPQLWAWGSWRLKKLRATVDHVFCHLPFEEQWFSDHGVQAENVGHPFFEEVQQKELDQEFLDQWKSPSGVQVALLPGSRNREVREIWPMQLAAMRELSLRCPGTRFLVACLKDQHRVQCQRELTPSDLETIDVNFFVDRTSEIIELADCALMKSGSVSLEMMARNTPAVVVYHAGRTLYHIGKRLSNLTSMTLPNLIARETVMPEFLAVGKNKTAAIQSSIEAMEALILDPETRSAQMQKLAQLTRQHGQSGASLKAANSIASFLRQRSSPQVHEAA